MAEPPPRLIPGRELLAEVHDTYRPFRRLVAERAVRVRILRFASEPNTEPAWQSRMLASRISADQKTRSFNDIGASVDHRELPATVSAAELAELLNPADTAAVIVQFPPPPALRDAASRIAPHHDIDAISDGSPHRACATADAAVRLLGPYLPNRPQIAVVGSRGFVGSGIMRLLTDDGHQPIGLDIGDELGAVRDADIVISAVGQPGILTSTHLSRLHQLVIDAGFHPSATGPVGDVDPAARALPQAITAVPGGMGPVEMAVLLERLLQHTVAPDLEPWRYQPSPDRLTTAAHTVTATVSRTLAADRARPLDLRQPGPRQPNAEPPRRGPQHEPPRRGHGLDR